MEGLIKRRIGDITWYTTAEHGALLEEMGELDKLAKGGTLLKKGKKKTFLHLETTINEKEIYLKTFSVKGLLQYLKYQFLKSKALRELEVSLLAHKRGVPVVCPLAAGERRRNLLLIESYLLIPRLADAIDLMKYFLSQTIPRLHKARAIESLGRISRKTHDAAILQEDFSLNNFLLASPLDHHPNPPLSNKTNDIKQVFLIDFERCHARQELSIEEKEWTLAKLNRIGTYFTLTDKFRFLKSYCKTKEEFRDIERWKRLEKYTHQILKRDAQRLSTACINADRGFGLFKDEKITSYFLEGYPLKELLSLATMEGGTCQEQRSHFQVSKRKYVITKEITKEPVSIYHFSAKEKDLATVKRAWQGVNGLLKSHFPVNPAVAAMEWVSNGDYRGILVLKESEKVKDIRESLRRYPISSTKRRSMLWHIARFLCRLHNFGTLAYNILPGDISWNEEQKWGRKLFLAKPWNFIMKNQLEARDRETDLERLEDYLIGILTEEEKQSLRTQYFLYSKIIS